MTKQTKKGNGSGGSAISKVPGVPGMRIEIGVSPTGLAPEMEEPRGQAASPVDLCRARGRALPEGLADLEADGDPGQIRARLENEMAGLAAPVITDADAPARTERLILALTRGLSGYRTLLDDLRDGKDQDLILDGLAKAMEDAAASIEAIRGGSMFSARCLPHAYLHSQRTGTDLARTETLWPGFMLGDVGALFGPGQAGKSWAAMEIGMSLAVAGVAVEPEEREILMPLLDPLALGITEPRKTLYISGEDRVEVFGYREEAAVEQMAGYVPLLTGGDRLGLGRPTGGHVPDYVPRLKAALEENLVLISARGECLDLGRDHDFSETDSIVSYVRENGFGLVIFDSLARFHTFRENDNAEMAGLIAKFERIAEKTGASVLLVHHVSKDAAMNADRMGEAIAAARGAGAIGDNLRYGLNLFRMTAKEAENCGIADAERHRYVKLTRSKQNYADNCDPIWLERRRHGFLAAVKPGKAAVSAACGGRRPIIGNCE
ncbi:MAG: helicase RepA family protein [Deltaproteobacteria bacterium]|nr:helicase RepA family protein [Deltaproteobacteria bacterium]